MKTPLLIISIGIILAVLLAIYWCMDISSKCSREDEEEQK